MNATVILWDRGIIVRTMPFQTLAGAKWFTRKFNSTRRPTDQRRALLTY